MPLVGGFELSTEVGTFSKCVITGICIMFVGYALMSAPTPVRSDTSLYILFAALLLISVGAGLFQGQPPGKWLGDLYNNSRYTATVARRCILSIFYYCPSAWVRCLPIAAVGLKNLALTSLKGGFLSTDFIAYLVCQLVYGYKQLRQYAHRPGKSKTMTEFFTKSGMEAGGDLRSIPCPNISKTSQPAAHSQLTRSTTSPISHLGTFAAGLSYAFAPAIVSAHRRRVHLHLWPQDICNIIVVTKKNAALTKAHSAECA